jgi:hypothetical protein
LKAGDRRELSEALGQTSLDETLQERKVGKAKAKRAKKAAAASAADTNDMVRFGHRPVIHPFAASLKLTVW